jgi:hypothetical protein
MLVSMKGATAATICSCERAEISSAVTKYEGRASTFPPAAL